jgi:IS5 family transposase
MRKMIEPQRTLGTVSMSSISFDIHCRHEIVPILMALQHLYSRPVAMGEICALIRNDIVGDRNEELGCSGMSYWEILVLASARLGCDLDYDALHDLANNHTTLRDIMRISRYDDERFPRATIHDNISKLSAETLTKISNIVVDEAHTLCPQAIEKVRGDSFVVQKNIHYPTDANLIYDGIRKTIQLTARLAEAYSIVGWRQHAHLLRKIKSIIRDLQRVARSKRKTKEEELKELYKKLIKRVHSIIGRSLDTISTVAIIESVFFFGNEFKHFGDFLFSCSHPEHV